MAVPVVANGLLVWILVSLDFTVSYGLPFRFTFIALVTVMDSCYHLGLGKMPQIIPFFAIKVFSSYYLVEQPRISTITKRAAWPQMA